VQTEAVLRNAVETDGLHEAETRLPVDTTQA
jgi:hypothetical protein